MPLADDGRLGAGADGAPPSSGGPDGGGAFLLAAIVALLAARVPLAFVRAFDNDEFEHAHAAWSVFKGLLPYRDFFEHHTPWYYFGLAPFFRWFSVDASFESARRFLIFGRLVSVGLTALAAVLVFLVGRLGTSPPVLVGRLRTSRRVGLLAALFFVGQPVVIHKMLELRPDVPSVPFFVGALWFLCRGFRADGARRLRWFLVGGLCLGATVMCTQKMLFVLPGAFIGLGLWALAGGRERWRARTLAVAVALVGVAAPTVVTWMAFAIHGGGERFIYDNFLINARWRWRTGRHILVILRTSWPILLLGLVGTWAALGRRRAGERDPGDTLLLCILGGLVGGLVVVPAAYEQYYLPALSIACVFAARGMSVLLDRSRHRARGWWVACATLPFLVWPVLDLGRAVGQRNDDQLARLRFVFAHTGPADPVLDGWLGTGVFRPHPNYYFFMHRELQVSLTEREKDDYVDALTSGRVRPALITLDNELRALGPRLVEFVHRRYVSSDGLFYLPVNAQGQ